MNTSFRFVTCLFASFLMLLGQPDSSLSTAHGAPQLPGRAPCDAPCDGKAGCDGKSGCSCRGRSLRQGCQGCDSLVQCPGCSDSFAPAEFCNLSIEKGETERTCFEVDFKTICIPKVVPPWKSGCAPQCAEARSVKILKKRKYKCPSCNYRWEVVKPEVTPATAAPTPTPTTAPGGQPTGLNQPSLPVVPTTDNYYGQQPAPAKIQNPFLQGLNFIPAAPAERVARVPVELQTTTSPLRPKSVRGTIQDYYGSPSQKSQTTISESIGDRSKSNQSAGEKPKNSQSIGDQ